MNEKKHVLVVDDVSTTLICAKEVLKDKYRVTTAKSGRIALEIMENEIPDLVLLDVVMPGMSGYEIYYQMKHDDRLKNVPVIFATGDTVNTNEAEGISMGAMDFVLKPFDPDVLISRIDRVLKIDSEKRGLEKQVELISEEANKDALTGLWNRKYTEEKVNDYLSDVSSSGVLFILDLDNFKEVNDTYGHIKGDAVLIELASILKKCAREDDIVCRIGGDEFIIFFKGYFDTQMASKKSEEIMNLVDKNMAQIICDPNGKGRLSVSIGITFAPSEGRDFMTLYGHADKSMYYVKHNGKCGYYFCFKDEEYEKSEEAEMVDMESLKKYISEYAYENGAYQVEYEGFKRIYQFVARCIVRTKQNVQTLLYTMERDESVSNEEFINQMQILENSIRESLRRGDVCSHFSKNQFVVLLMDTTKINGIYVADRVLDLFKDSSRVDGIKVSYTIEEINKNE